MSASKVAAEGAEAAVTQVRRRISEAPEEWETAGRRYYMELTEETAEETAARLARLTGAIAPSGQKHHLLTNRVMRALDDHETLAGVFRREDYHSSIRLKTWIHTTAIANSTGGSTKRLRGGLA